MLDGLYVTQPNRFLPIAQEAKKLAKELHKEEIASQWAGLPPEKLLQESFLEQLDTLQALDQLAPLTAVKEHLSGDIINILSHLRKADNIPFNQLYSLMEDCVDRYYMKVIQMPTPKKNVPVTAVVPPHPPSIWLLECVSKVQRSHRQV